MKYFITINQQGIVQAGLHKKTDLIDWVIIDYLRDWYFTERKKFIFVPEKGTNYIWINYNFLIESLPLIQIKDKDAISKRIKKLKNLGLIDTFQTKDNTLYFILTPYCIEIIGLKITDPQKSENKEPAPSKSDTLSDGDRIPCPTTIGQGCPTAIGQHNNILCNNISNNNIWRSDKLNAQESSFVKEVFKYYTEAVKKEKGFEPEISFAKEGMLVKRLSKRFSLEDIKKLIDWYLEELVSDSERLGCGLGVILSTNIINKWKQYQKDYGR